MPTKLPVHLALRLIDGELARTLPIRRLDKVDRSKLHIFELDGTKRQFGLVVGDFDDHLERFDRDETRVLLEQMPPPMEGIDPVAIQDYYNGGAAKRSFSRLAPPDQRSVRVETEQALRNLLTWYVTLGASAKPQPSFAVAREEPQQSDRSTPMAQNIILYGPPGTGKTFETARRAVQLCDGKAAESREELMDRYEALRKEGRIAFVTFHQSYGYEDFVEGLRPEVNGGQVAYRVRPGIFKELCDAARLARAGGHKPAEERPIRGRRIFKMSLGESSSPEGERVFQEAVESSRILLGWGRDVDFSDCKSADEIRKQFVEAYPDDENVDANIRYPDLLKHSLKEGDLVVASYGNSRFRAIAEVVGPYEFFDGKTFHQSRPVRWLTVPAVRPVSEIYQKNFMMSSLYELDKGAIKYDAIEAMISRRDNGRQDYVVIIDEINRANISKVLGELITLLEPDKRDGEINGLTVKLPYSGTDFTVPPNVHVIGTMNSADRSIALLDTALRRRFVFEELMPKPEVLPDDTAVGVDLRKMLQAMNDRIEALYDRDHAVGHAYLMGVKSLGDLELAFRRRILPLLQEYFHEDWSRIRRVLNESGEGRFLRMSAPVTVPGGEADVLETEPRPVFRVNSGPFGAEAFRAIYGE